MDALMRYLEMGGYARFVWPAYTIAAVVLAGLWIASRRRLRREEHDLADLEATLGIAGRRARRENSPESAGRAP